MSSPTLERARDCYLEAVESAGKSPRTIETYRPRLSEFETWLRANKGPLVVEEITSAETRGFLLDLNRRPKRPGHLHRSKPQGGLAAETIRGYYKTLGSFFSFVEREGWLNGHEPMSNVEKPKAEHKEVRILSDSEIERFLSLLDKPTFTKRTLFVAFSLMWRLGLRVSEVCKVRLSDLNLEQGSLLVRGKGRRHRLLPIPNSLRDLLNAYLTEVGPRYANGCDSLLVSSVSKPLHTSCLRKSFTRYAKRAGIVATPHVLRQSFATKAVRSGVSPFVLMKLLGHFDLKTTIRYVHANSFDDVAAALDMMG